MRRLYFLFLVGLIITGVTVFVVAYQPPGDDLRATAAEYGVRPLAPAPDYSPELVRLGQVLFFDKLISGNQDIACATCHHPDLATGDGRALSVGTGGHGLGMERLGDPARELVPRNAQPLFNLAEYERALFWDGRVEITAAGVLDTPAHFRAPAELPDMIVAQALFPVTSRDEMRGEYHDETEIASLSDSNFAGMWSAVMARLLANPDYVEMFAAAFPDVPDEQFGIEHFGQAIAAFEVTAFTLTDSAWDRYLRGDDSALTPEQIAGARLFFGEAGCATCHSGALLTDEAFYNLAVPQIGPGKTRGAPLDFGRVLVSRDEADMFRFRTPSLHNVTLTGPYMHSGAFATLEAVIRHKIDPAASLESYDPAHLTADEYALLHGDPMVVSALLDTLAPEIGVTPQLTDAQITQLVAFLGALTDPAAADLDHWVPERVPSGLPVAD